VGKVNAKGRQRESRHVRLYRYMWASLIERLDGNALKALFYMLTFEEGDNNGAIYMGARMLSKGIGVDKKTALRCLQHLDRQGFIRPEQLGYFQQKGGPATRWRFTFLPANGKSPTNEWRQPPAEQKSWGENFPDTGGEIPPKPSTRRATGGKIGPVEAETDQFAVGKKGTHTVAIGEGYSPEVLPAQIPSNSTDGRFAEIDGSEALAALRNKVAGHWKKLATAARRRSWAAANGISVEVLRQFVIANPDAIPFPKLAALASVIRAEEQSRRAAKVGRKASARG
jgi:hypothetical protein